MRRPLPCGYVIELYLNATLNLRLRKRPPRSALATMTEPHVTAPAPPPMPETAPAAERSASDDILRSRERGHASVQSLSSPQIAIHDAATTMTLPGPRRPSLANHM